MDAFLGVNVCTLFPVCSHINNVYFMCFSEEHILLLQRGALCMHN